MTAPMKTPWFALSAALAALSCGAEAADPGGAAGAAGAGGAAGSGGGSGGSVAGSAGQAGSAGLGGAGGLAGSSGAASTVGGAGLGGGGTGGAGGSGGGVSHVPAEYLGTPLKPLQIPGTIYAADYDRGGAGVAYCHGNANDCQAGVVTGDWAPAETPPYREVLDGGTVCGGAACDDNVGLCRMNPAKPDKTVEGVAVTPQDTYLCYVATTQWVKYTVQVAEAGTYAVGGFTAAPGGVTISLDFGDGISTGTFAVPESPTATCGCTESYHSWATHENLATVAFAEAGTYLMTFSVVTQQFNPDRFTFTKM
jgi:hypothetical protein